MALTWREAPLISLEAAVSLFSSKKWGYGFVQTSQITVAYSGNAADLILHNGDRHILIRRKLSRLWTGCTFVWLKDNME